MGSVKKDRKKRFLPRGITMRWLLTTILVMFLILAAMDATAVLIMHRYYYRVVEDKLHQMGQSAAISDFFSGYLNSGEEAFAHRAGEYVDGFSDPVTAEVWIIDKNGEPIVTTTGFLPEYTEIPDYTAALSSASDQACSIEYMSSGEKVMALTVLLPRTDGESNGGVRYIISLEPIDMQVWRLGAVLTAICLFALLLIIISGMFFVRSIVVPVKRLNNAAKNIAEGNYKEKVAINNRYDEITELGETINYMTEEIDRTDKMRSDFISTVSHELRTPLTAIKGWTETLISMNNNADETFSTGLTVIHGETDRLYSLVEDLLDFSRMESGRMSLRLEKTDLIAELEEAVLALSENASREGKEISYDIPDCVALANADPDRIKQVFVNVIDNAVKYTGTGGKIHVSASVGSGKFTVTVTDNGCGIAEEDLPHIKEKFYKANITVRGSGIGLAVCDEIVKLHGGSLDIASVAGEGTTVTVRFDLL